MVVLRDPKVVDGDLVEALQQLPRGTFNGDCILRCVCVCLLSNIRFCSLEVYALLLCQTIFKKKLFSALLSALYNMIH